MGRTLQIQTARAYLPLLKQADYKGIWGGRGSGKSHGVGEYVIDCHLAPGQRTVCVREVQKSLQQSVKQLLEDKIRMFGLQNQFRIMETEIRTPGDGLIIFQGMQNHTAESIKSLEGYDRAWVEEAQSLSQRSLTLLDPTIRKPGSEMLFTWNPSNRKDAVDKFLRGPTPPPNSIVWGTTYKDNPWFTAELRRKMEHDRATDIDKYNHVWLGGYEDRSDARVFKNWRIEPFETPRDAIFNTGADWGFAIDPATLVRSFMRERDANGQLYARKRLYIDYDISAKGVEIDHLPAFFDGLVCGCRNTTTFLQEGAPLIAPPTCKNPLQHGVMRAWPIIADSARPETISYLRRHGYARMESAKKGPNSVKEGVIFLQGFDIIVHPRCETTIDEFASYGYVRDPHTDIITPLLEDKHNHIIDPLRYANEQLRHVLVVRETIWG